MCIRDSLDAEVVRPPWHPAGDRAAKLLTESPTHGTVDEEVERVAEQDDQVDEHVQQIARVVSDVDYRLQNCTGSDTHTRRTDVKITQNMLVF